MLDFIIVDDSENIRTKIKNAVLGASIDLNTEINIHVFEEYNEELESLINNHLLNKIYLLDIELPGSKSGIDIATLIRDADINSNIIMVTSHDGLFETVYRSLFNVSDFIEKLPGFENRIINDIKKIINSNYDNQSFMYHNRDIDLKIQFRNIMYIYRDTAERKTYIVTDNNRFALTIPLVDMHDRLDYRFKQVHRACIINTTRIESLNWSKGYFVLDNGEEVYLLSKKYRGDIDD